MILPDRGCRFAESGDFIEGKQEVRWEGVALFTGAWIETNIDPAIFNRCPVALFTGAWIETGAPVKVASIAVRRALHGRVD